MPENWKKLSILTVLTVLLISLASPTLNTVAQAVKGPATDTLIFKRVPLDLAGEAIKAGEIDYYIFGLRPATAEALKGVEGIDLYSAPAGLVDFGLNPAPAPEGELNPLSIREVRFALNYLIDRDYVVSEIYKGFALPMYTFLAPSDPDYVVVYDIIAKYEFGYNPALADAIITEALTEAGAYKEAGKWYFNGKPIKLKFIIRVEDERREIGDALASELEKIGFTVERMYMEFGQAISTVYLTDPADLEWHIYTEGWGKGALDKYDYATINQFGCPWFGWLPGWGEEGYWWYTNDTLDELGQRIYFGKFSSKEERDQLYRKATEMIIQEAVRIWVATRMDIYPARSEVKGLTNDLAAGLRAPWNPREVHIEGKDTVKVGHLWVWTETTVWNPIAGHDDVYSVDIWRTVYDPWVWTHPFSGLPIPFRVTYMVETAGPTGTLSVPEDAFLWDANTSSWVAVGPDVTATSKVTFDLSQLLGTKWHHGQTITWADVLYGIYQLFDICFNPDKASREAAVASVNKPILETFKGFKITGDTTLEVYVDYWHFDDNYIAFYAVPPFPSYPWEVMAATDKVVFEKQQAAYSETASEKFGVPWLSLVLKDHAQMVANTIAEMKDESFLPTNVFTVLGTAYGPTSEEAQARYDAAIRWFEEKSHMVISDGPFYINVFDPAAQYAELKAFRDPSYPFSPGKWYFGIPTPVEILSVGIPTVVPGGDARFIVDLKGPAPLGVKYLIKDPVTGQILNVGSGEAVTPTRFVVSLPSEFTSKLEPGLYELTIAAYSEQMAFVSATKEFFDVLAVEPIIGGVKVSLEDLRERMESDLSDLRSQLGELRGGFEEISDALTRVVDTFEAGLTDVTNTFEARLGEVASAIQQVGSSVEDVKTSTTNQLTALTQSLQSLIDELSSTVEATVASVNTNLTIVVGLLVVAIILSIVSIVIAIRRP